MEFKKSQNIEQFFQFSLSAIINILIVYIILVLIIGLGKTLCSISDLFSTHQFAEEFSKIIMDVLSFLVILELFRSFIEYFKTKRFRLHSMIDPLLIFVVRELIVILYAHEKTTDNNLIGFSLLILSLGIVRTLAVIFSPESDK